MKINSINSFYNSNKYLNSNICSFNSRRDSFSDSFVQKSQPVKKQGLLNQIGSLFWKNCSDDYISQSRNYNKFGIIDKNTVIQDGFMDVGMSGKVYKTGDVYSPREIIIVDRECDEVLEGMICAVKEETSKMNVKEKADYLYSFISKMARENLKSKDASTEPFKSNTPTFLGDCLNRTSTTCRHYAILYKVLGDEINIPNDLVKGTLLGTRQAWNVVYLPNHRPKIYDVTNGIIEDAKKSLVYHPVNK